MSQKPLVNDFEILDNEVEVQVSISKIKLLQEASRYHKYDQHCRTTMNGSLRCQ